MTFVSALAPTLAPAGGPFDLITGLPVHPLVVHFAVVLLPLAALGLIVLVLVPKWRATFGWLVMAGLIIGTGASYVAKESGEALARRVGTPQQHASLGDVLPLVAGLLFIVALVWFLLDRKDRRNGQRSGPLVVVLGIAGILLAAAATILTVIVGHTGAEAAWSGKIAATESGGGTSATSAVAPGGSDGTLSAATVASHATATDCWSIVNGNVYDLTQWIPQHPGGAGVIEAMCGTDGTSAYESQHAGQGRPQDILDSFLIGPLATPAAAGTMRLDVNLASYRTALPAKAYTRKQVARHHAPSNCWSIVSGKVYNLTPWIPRHPGGAGVIISTCGRDGTALFTSQHGGQGGPAAILAQLQIGTLR